jgi:hypothetical protein
VLKHTSSSLPRLCCYIQCRSYKKAMRQLLHIWRSSMCIIIHHCHG